MINSFKSKSLKWSVVGLATIVAILCLVNPKADKRAETKAQFIQMLKSLRVVKKMD